MRESKSTLYGAIKRQAEHLAEVEMALSGHADAAWAIRFERLVLQDLVDDYKKAGGHRSVERFCAD